MNILIEYKVFVIPLIVIVTTQIIKFSRLTLKNGFYWHNLFEPGYFPSAHSAFVTSLAICVGFYSNGNCKSSDFAIAICFAFITIYDALRIRMQIGIQAITLNNLVKELDVNKNKFPHLNEHVGHYANEVAGGIFIGITISLFLIKMIAIIS